jgi:hypothetical protein
MQEGREFSPRGLPRMKKSIQEQRLEELETEFEPLLILCLRECAENMKMGAVWTR